ncbi:MAG: NYN domain-containing protein [Candidatus Doudnabacteria bacterium]|nr:NYN domain-containing protein [Candidatus Doudnabacteria bacterium]
MSNRNKTKVFIDGSNIFHAQKKLGWLVDWTKVKNYLEEDYEIVEWRYYIGIKDQDPGMQSFLRYLNAINIKAITKPLKKIALDSGDTHFELTGHKYIYKANFDVEITADILLDLGGVNEAILFSGDSDFVYLIKRLRDLGKKMTIYSSRKTISWELKLEAAKVIYLENLKDKIAKR